jgi:hypothetical protein
MWVLSGSEQVDVPRAAGAAAEAVFEDRVTRRLAEVLDAWAPGRASIRVARYTTVPYVGVSLEVVPRNPRAAPFEVIFDGFDVRVLVGSQGCRCHLPIEEALEGRALTFLQALFQSVVLGEYGETTSRRHWWLCRVEGSAGPGVEGPPLSAPWLWIYGTPRTTTYEPY